VDLELTDDQNDLRQSVQAVLERECPIALARRVVETGEQPDALWRTMAELDWFGLSVPEAAGGLGLGFTEVAVVVEELGRRVAPGPFLATMTQYVPTVVALGTDEQVATLLGPVAAGQSSGALALADHPRRWEPTWVSSTARPGEGGWVLSGTKRAVLAGEDDALVVVARVDGVPGDAAGRGLFVVPAGQGERRPVAGLDASRPLCDVVLDGVTVPDERVLGQAGSDEVGRVVDRVAEVAALGLAVELVGTCGALLDLAVAYAIDRRQFGVPIGTFQGVKHKMADCYVALQRARALTTFAVAAVAEDDPRRTVAVAMAKAAAGECQHRVCQDAFQTFGGIGFTWEHDQQLFVKRAVTAAALFGSAADHRRVVASDLGIAGA
jgi:alkylation response protein AidB-like acyl-CoA dehydrogenase